MFHRVKSEVQDTEQQTQKEQNSGYRQDEVRPVSARTGQEESPSSPRAYERDSINAKQEERSMSVKEEAPVQGKYAAADQADEQNETSSRVSGYQPSISRPSANYGASAYSAPSYNAPQQETYSATDRTLTIGRGINMSGEIESCDHLMVEGTVEAALKGAKLLEIAQSGTFYGTVEIEEATIAGRFEGDITVNGRLTIKSSGVITGSIAYRELEVEAGAVLDGRMTPLKGNVDPKSADNYRKGTEASAMAKAKEIVSKKDNREPANTERGLFSKAHASY